MKGLTRFFRVDTSRDDQFLKSLPFVDDFSNTPVGVNAFEVSDHSDMTANDIATFGPHSWGIDRVIRRKAPYNVNRPPKTWNSQFFTQRTGRGVDIYILESAGYETSLPEFQNREGTCQLLNGSTEDMSYLGYFHPNAVASCAGGAKFGVARGANMFLVTTYDYNQGTTSPTQVSPDSFIAAVDAIIQHHQSRSHLNTPAVINFSTIGALSPAPFQDAINAGIVWVSAGGNNGQDTSSQYLSTVEADPYIIGVGGIQANDTHYNRAGFLTAHGEAINVYAPGQYLMMQFLSTDTPSGYGIESGTSFAAPITTGVIACMLEGHGRLQNREQVNAVKQKLIENSTKDAIRVTPNSPLYDSYQAGESYNRIVYLDPFISFEQIPGVPTL